MILTQSCHSRHISTSTSPRHSGPTPSSTRSTTGSSEWSLPRHFSRTSPQTGDTWEKESTSLVAGLCAGHLSLTLKCFTKQSTVDRSLVTLLPTEDGTWLKPPPSYPCIANSSTAHNLEEFISMEASKGDGEVLSLTEFVKKFHRH